MGLHTQHNSERRGPGGQRKSWAYRREEAETRGKQGEPESKNEVLKDSKSSIFVSRNINI